LTEVSLGWFNLPGQYGGSLPMFNTALVSTFAAGVGALAAAGAIALSPNAKADESDSKFLDTMRSMGADTSNSAELIKEAHQICAQRAGGETEHAAVDKMSLQSNVSSATAFMFVGAAELNYCPDYYATYHPGQQ
jgi:archaellum biogenesis protein FlaJ (TadC family)